MKGAKVRRASVRRMWFSVGDDIACPTKNDPRFWWDEIRPVIVLPATPEDIEGYVEAMANALCCEHMGALPGAYSLTPEKDCAKGSESAYMWRSARAALAALMKGRK